MEIRSKRKEAGRSGRPRKAKKEQVGAIGGLTQGDSQAKNNAAPSLFCKSAAALL
jgi:hypothetical protein